MSEKNFDNFNSPPNYPGPPNVGPSHPQAAYTMNNMPQQQSPYMGQQPLPNMQTQYQHTTTRTTTMGQPQMAPMQPQMTGQPQMMMGQAPMMNMGPQMSMGVQQPVQPMQPQTTGVMMNVVMPGATSGGTNYMDLCAQGMHARTTRYGACGIITAIVFFPLGLIALFLDVEEYCVRCGTRF